MIDASMIPDEVVEAAAQAFRKAMHDHWGWPMLPWDEVLAEDREYWRKLARTALAAALSAWPNAKWHEVQVPDDSDEVRYMLKKVGLILPLPKEGE
jgi:hypothetical protein